jgi:hypothetical protein
MIAILFTVALLAQTVATPVSVTTRIEGRVINSLNGEAVPKTTVILRAHDQEHGVSYADETDGNGHFSIGDVEPGEYAILAERPGFGPQSTGATGAPPPSVKVEKGQQLKDVAIRLTPLGVIMGRVLDADGDPVRGANVDALRYGYSAGKKELTEVQQVQSGENGDFRLFGLGAGTFYLKATHISQGPAAPPESVSTYYPGTLDPSHAAPVVLRAGVQLRGFDIRLQSTGTYTIRFKFPEMDTPAPNRGFAGFLVSAQGQGVEYGNGVTFTKGGLFFSGVPPGSYEVVLMRIVGGKRTYAIQPIEVANADVDGGTLTTLPSVEVTGAVRVEGGVFKDLDKVHINLQSQPPIPMMGNLGAAVKPDGSFLLSDAAPGTYDIAINRTPGVYLKSVRIGDKQMADRRVDLSSRPEPLTIVLSADVGEVEGSVQNAKGEPVARARVNVIAYGDHSSRTDLNRFGFTDEKGEFKIKDVAPGEYKVFGWEDVPVGAPQDPEFRKPFEKQAASIRMLPNGHEKISVTAIAPVLEDRSSQ